MPHYNYIAIEGNIGAGKTTLARLLAREMEARFLPEQFEDNPFLSLFYQDPQRYAFTVELSFLEERFRQMKEADRYDGLIISDYLWEKSLVFARVNLPGEELRLFERIYRVMGSQLRVPDLVVYLHRPPDRLLRQITGRGREFEKNIAPEYLLKVSAGYRDYFASERRMPVIWLDNELGPEALAKEVMRLTRRQLSNGLHLNP